MTDDRRQRFEGMHGSLTIERPARGIVVLRLAGTDVGELGDAPFQALAADVEGERPLELFVDAREVQGASIDVSNDWAIWLRRNRTRLAGVTMLTASRFIKLTAEFVRRFAELGDTMRVTTDGRAFDEALEQAVRQAGRDG